MKYSERKISQCILSLKVICVLFDKKLGTSIKKKENYNPADKILGFINLSKSN